MFNSFITRLILSGILLVSQTESNAQILVNGHRYLVSASVVVAQWNFGATANTVAGWVNVTGNPDATVVTASDNRSGATIGFSTINSTDAQIWSGNAGVASANVALSGTGHVLPTGLYLSYFQNNPTYTTGKPCIEITGLDNSKTYKIEILSSRQGSGDARTSRFYTIDNSGTVNSTIVSGNYNGDFNYVVTGKVPISGKISLFFGQGAGFVYGYLNALKVTQE